MDHLHLDVVVLRPLEDVLRLLQPFAELWRVLGGAQLAVVGFEYGAHSIALLQQTQVFKAQAGRRGRHYSQRCSRLLSVAGLSFRRTAMLQRDGEVLSSEQQRTKRMHFEASAERREELPIVLICISPRALRQRQMSLWAKDENPLKVDPELRGRRVFFCLSPLRQAEKAARWASSRGWRGGWGGCSCGRTGAPQETDGINRKGHDVAILRQPFRKLKVGGKNHVTKPI